MITPIYRLVLAAAFDALPPRVRELHDLQAPAVWLGRADVKRGASLTARVLATLFGLPPNGPDQPLSVTFTPMPDHEIWQRNFAGRIFLSRQYAASDRIREAVGPVSLIMRPVVTSNGMSLNMVGARLWRLPLPSLLVPRITTREYEGDGRYCFEVSATLPLIGPLVEYRGWLAKRD